MTLFEYATTPANRPPQSRKATPHPEDCDCGGFDRNGSHDAGEYVGYCNGPRPTSDREAGIKTPTPQTRPETRGATQQQLVYAAMKHGGWWTFESLRHHLFSAYNVGISEPGVSARIRDLRKAPYRLNVERRPTSRKGIWEYRVST